MKSYNGHPSWTHWNVSLWVNNDEQMYKLATRCVRRCEGRGGKSKAAQLMLEELHALGAIETPDGARYSASNLRHAIREY